jgi:hypothetical protein
MKSLCLKRFYIFRQRYLIALLSLAMPVLIICLAKIIPSGYSIVTSALFKGGRDGSFPMPIYDLDKDWSLFGHQIIPYTLNVANNETNDYLTQLVRKHFPFGQLLLVKSDDNVNNDETALNNYVYVQRKENSIHSLLNSYYVGICLRLNEKRQLSAKILFNTMSFHASASALHRIDNLMLEFYSSMGLASNLSSKFLLYGSNILFYFIYRES